MLQTPHRFAALTALLASALSAQIPQPASLPEVLTRQEAERIALANNPRIRITQLLAKVQGQAVREARAAELPTLSANLTGVAANQASRLGASPTLTASLLLDHASAGVQFNQLLTDFGRTRNLVASEKLKEKARQADAAASADDIVLATDQLFFQALQAQATLQIADQTVATRQALADKVSALTASHLKSTLDLSFAQVDLSRAKLLQLDARNNIESAKAALTAVLGYDRPMTYRLADDAGDLPPLPPDPAPLIAAALRRRPDLQSLQFTEQSAQKFSLAQRAQLLPTVSATGVVGATPFGASQYFTSDWYGALGLNIGLPLFDGFRYRAQASAAALQVRAASEQTRARRNEVARDVQTAWLNANTALQRVTVAAELLNETTSATDLAQTRYVLGLSAIVDVSQAQLQQTEAAIGDANARSQYRLAIAELRFQIGGEF